MTIGDHFEACEEWHEAITQRRNLTLTKTDCEERIRALSDPKEASTRDFSNPRGEGCLRQLIPCSERTVRTR